MPVIVDREDRLLDVARKNLFADNHGVEITTEGILDGFRALQKRPEIQELDNIFKDYISAGDEKAYVAQY